MEQCLSARPITPVSPGTTLLDALTPSHILLGTLSSILPSDFRHEIEHRKQNVRAQTQFGIVAQGVRSKPQP